MGLTVAQAAGIISFGVVVLQLTFPLLMVLILVGLLSENVNAATCSVVGRFLNASYWPTILQTDTAMSTNVNRRGVILPMLSTGAIIVLAVAAVITPLGLYDQIIIEDPTNALFTYVRDTSPLGNATQSRDEYNVSRLCGSLAWMSCPGQNHGFWISQNSTGLYVNWEDDDSYISSVIPANLSEIFSSGRTGDMALVASPFDLQFRTYGVTTEAQSTSVLLSSAGDGPPPYHVDQGRPRTVGKFAAYESFVLTEDFVIREGIVADMTKGGIGFRNHTLPHDVKNGSRWTEGLLWLEPESVCVANNLSLKAVPPVSQGSADNQYNYLVDNGGFVNLTHHYPYIDLNRSQTNPKLWNRAYKAAVLFNANLKLALDINNTTNLSYIGREFTVASGESIDPGIITIGLLDVPPAPLDISPDPSSNASMFTEIGIVVQGYGGRDKSDDDMIAVGSGIIYGGARSQDNNPSTRFEAGNPFVADVYSCVTAIRAFVMDVTFFIEGTPTLNNLKVEMAVPRSYEDDLPLWAFEKTNMNISDVSPLWGLVDDKYETADYLETLRRDFMYVPTGSGSFSFGVISGSDSFGASIPALVLDALYDSATNLGGGVNNFPAYSGIASYPLSKKWTAMTSSVSSTPTMLSLIWTDIMINAVVGARGQLNWNYVSALNVTDRAKQTAQFALVRSQSYVQQLGYHVRYAVPAIIFLTVYFVVLATTIIFLCIRRATFTMLRTVLNQTAVGRAVTIERYRLQEGKAMDATSVNDPKTLSSRDWVRSYGNEGVDISKRVDGASAHGTAYTSSRSGYQPVARSSK